MAGFSQLLQHENQRSYQASPSPSMIQLIADWLQSFPHRRPSQLSFFSGIIESACRSCFVTLCFAHTCLPSFMKTILPSLVEKPVFVPAAGACFDKWVAISNDFRLWAVDLHAVNSICTNSWARVLTYKSSRSSCCPHHVLDADGIADRVFALVVQASNAVALFVDNSLKSLHEVSGNYCFKRRWDWNWPHRWFWCILCAITQSLRKLSVLA